MYCQVIVDIAHENVDRVFIYRIPESLTLEVGMRVHFRVGLRVFAIIRRPIAAAALAAWRGQREQ